MRQDLGTAGEEATPTASPCPQRETVLVVDEVPARRRRTRDWLEDDGYYVIEAGDIPSALARQSETCAAVALLHPRVAGMEGFRDVGAFELLPEHNRPTATLYFLGEDGVHDGLRERIRRGCDEHCVSRRMQCLARRDDLTGLPNRAGFLESLDAMIDGVGVAARAAALLCLDVDGFRLVNDTLGHAAGDLLLRTVAERLGTVIPRSATLARTGDDEFVVLLPGTCDAGEVSAVARSLREALVRPVRLREQDVIVPFGLGVAMYPHDGADAPGLMRSAATALHRAKQAGRGSTRFYDVDMGAEMLARMSMECGLRDALERHEFELHYQPLVDLRDGTLRSLEALVRWNHPRLGRVSPAAFIPVAEETGLIHRLGVWVLETACAQTVQWCGELDYRFRIAVNVSGLQFEDPEFVPAVRGVLDRTGLDPSRLELELTENVVMRDIERTVATMAEVKSLGIRVSVDDFGTGYSSLAVLRRLPLDTLKIDGSFVGNLPHAADDCAIVRAIVAMAHSLRLEVVAEGVENWQQIQFLRGLGVETVQGFHVGVPADAASTAPLVAAGRTLLRGQQAETPRPLVLGRERVFRC